MKLTKAQQRALDEICKNSDPIHGIHFAKSYPPAIALVENGLARWCGKYLNRLEPTDAGRKASKPSHQQMDLQ